tara:strand:+ start:2400 stop:3140 length:741 start_codon:yes stop_codon:yes gene_type:complete
MKKLDLDDISNYSTTFNCSIENAFIKYSNIIEEFLIASNPIKNSEYYKYVLIKGIENTYHIFNMLLLYSKNIEFSCYHTQRSYLYYCEFIEQIKNDNNKLLNLNIKDATLFIYKKILYNIEKDNFKITQIEEKNIILLDKIIMLYNNILSNSIILYDANLIQNINKNIVKTIFKNTFNDMVDNIDTIRLCNDVIFTRLNSIEKTIQLYKLILKYIKTHKITSINAIDIDNINTMPNNKIIKKLFRV